LIVVSGVASVVPRNTPISPVANMALIAPPRQIEHRPDPEFSVIEGGDISKVRDVAEELGPQGDAVVDGEFELGGVVEACARRTAGPCLVRGFFYKIQYRLLGRPVVPRRERVGALCMESGRDRRGGQAGERQRGGKTAGAEQ